MATQARLRLKAQVIIRPQIQSTLRPFVRVWVDTGVFHLNNPFDYGVPEELAQNVQLGIRLQVPFNGREVEAIVLERLDETVVTGAIKSITKILSPHAVATQSSLNLIDAVAKHWATSPFDILRSAIPPRIAHVDKHFKPEIDEIAHDKGARGNSSYIAFEPHGEPEIQILHVVAQALKDGSVLLIAPNERDIDAICAHAGSKSIPYIRLDSSQPRAARYENYLRAMHARKTLIIGARGAVFTPLDDLSTVIVYKESSHEHYEIRSPGWNVRDVLRIRQNLENINIVYSGYVPSLEISTLIENKKLKYVNKTHKLTVKAFSSDDGALLPGRIFSDIRSALTMGPVLFLAPRKGYGNALLCAYCKNLAICNCGARLVVGAKDAAPSCTICQEIFPEWSCRWCHRSKQYLTGRGIERAAEEISRAFTGSPLLLSFGDVIKTHIESRSVIVLATPGAAPKVSTGYAAIVLLEGLKFFSHPDLRAQERARELFFETASMLNPNGVALLCIDETHPIVTSLVRWNPGVMIRRELAERFEIPLPPFVSSFIISGSAKDFTSIAAGLRKAVIDGRLPASIRIFGPSDTGKLHVKIVLYCPHQDSAALTNFLHELQRRRSIAKKELMSVRIDPYS